MVGGRVEDGRREHRGEGELSVEAVGGVTRERDRVDAGRSEPRTYEGYGTNWASG
jgi:hypothetical protein